MAGELLEFPARHRRPGHEPRRGPGRRRAARRLHRDQGRRRGQAHRQASCPCPSAMPSSAASSTPWASPSTARARIATNDSPPVERHRPRRRRPPARARALQTGIKAIDAMIPIGRGQRELIIGDRQTGKTAIALDTIINQKDTRPHLHLCRHRTEALHRRPGRQDARRARRHGLHHRGLPPPPPTRRRCSTSRPTPAAPSASTSATAAARPVHLRRSFQARRGLPPNFAAAPPPAGPRSLSRRRVLSPLPPARARRKLSDKNGGGSLTALPIIETQAGDVSAYIPTNVISITDGQIYLEADLFNSGVRPAVNVGISVCRVGGAAQIKAMKQVGRHAAPRPRPVPRAGSLRPVRLRPRQGHAGAARPRRAPGRAAQAGPVRAPSVDQAGRGHLRRHQRLPG